MRLGHRQQKVEEFFLNVFHSHRPDLFEGTLLGHIDGNIRQLADHALNIAADIADLREFRRFDLDKRRICEASETCKTCPRDCGECGTKNDPDAIFCKKCGSRQATLAATTTPDDAEEAS